MAFVCIKRRTREEDKQDGCAHCGPLQRSNRGRNVHRSTQKSTFARRQRAARHGRIYKFEAQTVKARIQSEGLKWWNHGSSPRLWKEHSMTYRQELPAAEFSGGLLVLTRGRPGQESRAPGGETGSAATSPCQGPRVLRFPSQMKFYEKYRIYKNNTNSICSRALVSEVSEVSAQV